MYRKMNIGNLISTTFIFYYYSYFVEGVTRYLTANETVQYITSPNYPQSYGDSSSMSWVITATNSIEDPSVYLRVIDSQLQPSLACYNDVVAIYDGISSLYPEIVSICGFSFPTSTIHSKYRTIMIDFASDSSDNNYRGFKIAYWAKTTAKVKYVTKPFTTMHYTLLGIGCAIIFVILCVLVFVIFARNREKIASLFENEDV
ncbi:ovochymase-2-like [Saccostrea cucullata]|uniref:ovochymase-2-like n=1 Tax=Saccostrea cuccullata TaxID=36930 RepID=UPI002ED03482